MVPHRLILLILVGAAAGIFAAVTLQWYIVFIILVFVVLVLLASDFKKWVESLVEKIVHAGEITSGTGLQESITSANARLAGIERRLDALEKGDRG